MKLGIVGTVAVAVACAVSACGPSSLSSQAQSSSAVAVNSPASSPTSTVPSGPRLTIEGHDLYPKDSHGFGANISADACEPITIVNKDANGYTVKVGDPRFSQYTTTLNLAPHGTATFKIPVAISSHSQALTRISCAPDECGGVSILTPTSIYGADARPCG